MDTETASATLPEHLTPVQAEKIKQLTPNTYCLHRSWGFGQIKQWDTVADSISIDFKTKKGHTMQFAYAADSLTPLTAEHLLVQKAETPDALKEKIEKNPVQVVIDAIKSLGPQATADGIQNLLSPDVISPAAYKKWWEGAKRAMKKNGHFYIPTKKSEPLRQLEAASALGDSALEHLRLANGPKAILAALPGVIKYWGEIKSDSAIQEVTELLDSTLSKIPKSQLPLQLELALARDEFLKEAGQEVETGPLAVTTLTPQTPAGLSPILDLIPGSKQPKLLEALRLGLPEAWPQLFLGLLPRSNGRVAETITEAFQAVDRQDDVVGAINRLIRERNITCDFLFWFCKNRPEIFSKLIEPQLFMAILSVLEKDQFSEIKKGTKLYELVLADKALTAAILKDAPLADVRDITRAILLSPVFEELDKRSLLATIIKLYPEVQAMVVGGDKSTPDADEAGIIVSWPSLQRRKAELEDIVLKQIPQNSKDIGIARGYGDLRENHEFKSAKEMQTILMRRKAELEQMLVRAQGTDFAEVDTSKVSLGTEVTLRDLASKETLTYIILGAWDSDPTKGIISYQTAVAKTLLNHGVGDEVDLTADDGSARRVKIEKISRHSVDLSVPA